MADCLVIGRSPDCDVCIPDRRISRRHARVHWDGASFTLHDLDSANGTYLNGQRITIPEALRDGDQIEILGAFFTFWDPEATIRVHAIPLLAVDQPTGEIRVDRNLVLLSAKEQALFDFLYGSGGRVCSKQEIAEAVWPEYQAQVYDYQTESLVKRLREKLEPDPRKPVLLITVRGRGYRLLTNR